MSEDPNDLARRVSNGSSYGRVMAVDYARARAKVQVGEIETAWLPWTTTRAGGDRAWAPLEVGEQVFIAAPNGDLAQACIMGSVYQTAHPAPANSGDVTRTEYKDGAFEAYDRAAHEYVLNVPAGGKIKLVCGASTLEISNDGVKVVGPRIDLNP